MAAGALTAACTVVPAAPEILADVSADLAEAWLVVLMPVLATWLAVIAPAGSPALVMVAACPAAALMPACVRCAIAPAVRSVLPVVEPGEPPVRRVPIWPAVVALPMEPPSAACWIWAEVAAPDADARRSEGREVMRPIWVAPGICFRRRDC